MPNPSNKRLRRAIYGQSPSSDGSTFTIEDGAGRGKDLVVGSGSVFNLEVTLNLVFTLPME